MGNAVGRERVYATGEGQYLFDLRGSLPAGSVIDSSIISEERQHLEQGFEEEGLLEEEGQLQQQFCGGLAVCVEVERHGPLLHKSVFTGSIMLHDERMSGVGK